MFHVGPWGEDLGENLCQALNISSQCRGSYWRKQRVGGSWGASYIIPAWTQNAVPPNQSDSGNDGKVWTQTDDAKWVFWPLRCREAPPSSPITPLVLRSRWKCGTGAQVAESLLLRPPSRLSAASRSERKKKKKTGSLTEKLSSLFTHKRTSTLKSKLAAREGIQKKENKKQLKAVKWTNTKKSEGCRGLDGNMMIQVGKIEWKEPERKKKVFVSVLRRK